MERKYHYIRSAGVRQAAKDNEKQVSRDFLEALDRQVFALIVRACKANGGNKRLNASVIE